MAKITILSPVHIGTGNKIENPSYKSKTEGMISKYDFIDLLTQIPANVLLNSQLHKDIYDNSKNKQKSKQLYQYVSNNVNYKNVQSKYDLTYHLAYELSDYAYDVCEQIKSLGSPYIPGSTIKGLVINAFLYSIIKNDYTLTEDKIESIIKMKRKLSVMDLLQLGNLEDNEKKSFLVAISTCIRCVDIQFKDMELYEANRVGAKNGNEMPLPYMECISVNQCVENDFIQINEEKLDRLKKEYANNTNLMNILSKINIKNLLSACDAYTQEMLEEELSNRMQELYAGYRPINKQLLELRKLQQSFKTNKKSSYLLRLGNSTNYNFKTVTLFIRKNYPELYDYYYTNIFCPERVSRGKKTKSNSKTMPKTRVVLSNQEGYVLSGFIQVSYD